MATQLSSNAGAPRYFRLTHAHNGTDTGPVDFFIAEGLTVALLEGIDCAAAAVSFPQIFSAVATLDDGSTLWADGSSTSTDTGKYLSWRGAVPFHGVISVEAQSLVGTFMGITLWGRLIPVNQYIALL